MISSLRGANRQNNSFCNDETVHKTDEILSRKSITGKTAE